MPKATALFDRTMFEYELSQRGWQPKEVAKRAKINIRTLQRIQQGIAVDLITARKICDVFGVTHLSTLAFVKSDNLPEPLGQVSLSDWKAKVKDASEEDVERSFVEFFGSMRPFSMTEEERQIVLREQPNLEGFVTFLQAKAKLVQDHLDSIILGRRRLYAERETTGTLEREQASKFAERWKIEFEELHRLHLESIFAQKPELTHRTMRLITTLLNLIFTSTKQDGTWSSVIYSLR